MRLTIEISDSLLKEAKKVASRKHIPLRALIENGLRRVLAERKRTTPFKLRKATFKGNGLQRFMEEGTWERIRDFAYQGHGS